MGLLLYKSQEMFSATELIRKSKMIFDKVVNHEIDKAIILRDGKPGFLLMDFAKYEKIMAEYEELKEFVDKQNIDKLSKKPQKPKKIKKEKEIKEVTEISSPIIQEMIAIKKEPEIKKEVKDAAFVTPPRPKPEIKSTNTNDQTNTIVEEKIIKEEEISASDELKNALNKLRSMNLDDDMRILAEEKIRNKLALAREERARLLEQENEEEKADLKEELEIQVHIKEENKKKERELKEFWD